MSVMFVRERAAVTPVAALAKSVETSVNRAWALANAALVVVTADIPQNTKL